MNYTLCIFIFFPNFTVYINFDTEIVHVNLDLYNKRYIYK